MKIKQHITISIPEDFFKGDYSGCFTLFDHPAASEWNDWIDVGEIEIEVSDDLVEKSQAAAMKSLKKAEKSIKDQYTKDIIRLETARAELLCITDQSAA